MREFKSFSASQVSTFRTCKRQWWFQSIMGLPTPQRASAALGEAVHTQLEDYLNDGKLPDGGTPAGKIATAALPYAPKPFEVWTEVSMSDRKKRDSDTEDVPMPGNMPRLFVAGLPVNGFIDVLDLSGDRPVVIDWKTTSDLKYAKTADDLMEDPQMILYGSYALEVCASMGVMSDTVDAGHVVLLTKGAPQARKTMVTLNAKHLERERGKIGETVEEMKVRARATSPDDVPGEASACSMYGGCHFRDKCQALGMLANVSATASMFAPQPQKEVPAMSSSVDPMAALAAIRARKAAEAAAAASGTPMPAAPAAPAPQPVAQPAASTANPQALAALEKLGIRPAGTHAAQQARMAQQGAVGIVPDDTPSQVKPAFAQTTPAPAPVAPAVVEEASDEAKSVRKPRDYATKLAALNWTPEQVAKLNAATMRWAIEGNEDGRGYSVLPNGTVHKPGTGAVDTTPTQDDETFYRVFPEEKAAAAAPPVAQTNTNAQLASLATTAAPVAAPVATPNLVLYIDAMPEKGRERDYVLLEDYIQPMLPVVTEAYNKTARDNERVDFYSLIPYARGPAFIAALVMKNPPKGVVVANTRFPATNAILEVLIPMADVVVRGLR